ncbi:hypothetical protein OsJ_12542 [Oryza sativa Japonica Group]|uniref:Glycosyltransferase n=1 Tax=Oryza sativa subsp. japonica TaxID=39947 RepID=B9FBS3_ORYSJ|nr:hypothetical protein OsJ_12542 [Oryza sativa Japonica Group]
MADAIGGGGRRRRLRVFFLPFFAKGHLIPMTDLACRMAAAGPEEMDATMVVTPGNAALIATAVTRAAARGHPVGVLCYPFPDVGMERGVDPSTRRSSSSTAPTPSSPTCPSGGPPDIAAELGVPRLTFSPVGVFPQLAMNNLVTVRAEIIRAGDAAPPVPVPGMPGKEISIPAFELPNFLLRDDQLSVSWDRIRASQLAGFGVAVNTFVDLEQTYCHEFSRVDARRAYFVGPVGMSSNTAARRGGNGNDECLRWLSTKPSRSVVYVSFGSWAYFSRRQVRELALGLEASNHPFLWVIRPEDSSGRWAPEGWEQRVAGPRHGGSTGARRSWPCWAHPSVGAFVSHCGWSSVLEAASAGVPVLAWPLVFEQFINERLVTEVVAFGARVRGGGRRSAREGEPETVPAEAVARAVAGIMARGGDGDRARARARVLAERARAAVGEGGSSWRDIHRLIDDLTEATASPEPQLQ